MVKNVENGIGFKMAIEMESCNLDVGEDLKNIVILMAAINILKNQNASIELKEEIKNIIENMENSLNDESKIKKK